tara:strand:- start:2260 stop:3426 length:1167 start_codon:yes stop_codon:yes gene_type:complete
LVIIALLVLLILLLIIGILESYLHEYYLRNIPIRIHVNGARGKSSVTRLIASGLRETGKKVLAKTTGSSPRIINEKGQDIAIHRLRSASIGEQVRLIRNFSKQNIDILIIECMAVQPQYQWISEQKMIKSSVSVITNVRPDHLDEMGYTMNDIAMSLSNSIPSNGTLVIHNDKFSNLFNSIASKRNTKVNMVEENIVDETYMRKFDYFEHQDNVELALSVCENLGVSREVALKGILKNRPDPGALVVWKVEIKKSVNYFISAFAANDPQSTYDITKKISNRYGSMKKCIFLNTRSDRQYRTHQLLSLVYEKIIPEKLFIRGNKLDAIINQYNFNLKGIEIVKFDEQARPLDIIKKMGSLDDYLIFGIGNIVGWGDEFVKNMKDFKIND